MRVWPQDWWMVAGLCARAALLAMHHECFLGRFGLCLSLVQRGPQRPKDGLSLGKAGVGAPDSLDQTA